MMQKKKDDTKEAKKEKTAAGKKGKGVEANQKALKFQEFLMENDIDVFSTETLDDDYQTVVFRSRVEARSQVLPLAIFIDTSVFTLIRTQIVTGISKEKRARVTEYINELNIKYKIFKYYLRQDGVVYLDICLPFAEDTFDSNMIQLMLSVLVRHLEEIYEDFMECVWSRERLREHVAEKPEEEAAEKPAEEKPVKELVEEPVETAEE